MSIRGWVSLFKSTVREWNDDNASTLGAALSFYTLFALAPLLVITISIAGMVYGPAAARGQVVELMTGYVGQGAAQAIQDMLASMGEQKKSGIIASVIGLGTLLFGASKLFTELQRAMNLVWKMETPQSGGIWATVWDRALAFGLVLFSGLMFLVLMAAGAAVAGMTEYFSGVLPGGDFLWQAMDLGISVAVITVVFAMLFKFLPAMKIQWRDVWLGALFTAVLFVAGKYLLGMYLGRSSIGSTYGAAGSLVVLMVWTHYAAQIFFFGAEFTQVYAARHGSRPALDEKKVLRSGQATGTSGRQRGQLPQKDERREASPESGKWGT